MRANLDGNGSQEYALTWKQWDMESGPQICALRASPARRTSGSGCGGWGTPDTTAREHSKETQDKRLANRRDVHGKNSVTLYLPDQAKAAGWPTVSANEDAAGTLNGEMQFMLSHAALTTNPDAEGKMLTTPEQSGGPAETGKPGEFQEGGWPSPKVADDNNDRMSDEAKERELVRPERGGQLAMDAFAAGWKTPNTMDSLPPRDPATWKEWNNQRDGRKNRVAHSNLRQEVLEARTAGYPTPNATDSTGPGTEGRDGGENLQTAVTAMAPNMAGWKLNPAFSLWLMGYPAAWASCGALAMQSTRKSRRSSSGQHGKQSTKR